MIKGTQLSSTTPEDDTTNTFLLPSKTTHKDSIRESHSVGGTTGADAGDASQGSYSSSYQLIQPRKPQENDMLMRIINEIYPYNPNNTSYVNLLFNDRHKRRSSAVTSFSNFEYGQKSSVSYNVHLPYEFPIPELRPKQVEEIKGPYKLDYDWGQFYINPELWDDEYSPVFQVRDFNDLKLSKDEINGKLTVDVISCCLSYFAKNPISDRIALVKLVASHKNLRDISILSQYQYLQYLDLADNFLNHLSVLDDLCFLMYLNVSYNNLNEALGFRAPWNLIEVDTSYNSIDSLRDLSEYRSLTILNLSHNNIKKIEGLHNLCFLRKLDLSFNNIRHLENLSSLRIVYLDLSNNMISDFECSNTQGLWTLADLEYLNLNDNYLRSLRIINRCTRLRKMNFRNNLLLYPLDIELFTKGLKDLRELDFRGNRICESHFYYSMCLKRFSHLLFFDGQEIDIAKKVHALNDVYPDPMTLERDNTMKLLLLEYLSTPYAGAPTPAADSSAPPIVILVGPHISHKGELIRRLVQEFPDRFHNVLTHTTMSSPFVHDCTYIFISKAKFTKLMAEGKFLAYSEVYCEGFGISRDEMAKAPPNKILLMRIPGTGSLSFAYRGLRPYLILTVNLDDRDYEAVASQKFEISISLNGTDAVINESRILSTIPRVGSSRFAVYAIINQIILNCFEDESKSNTVLNSDFSSFEDQQLYNAIVHSMKDKRHKKDEHVSAGLKAGDSQEFKPDDQLQSSLYSLYKYIDKAKGSIMKGSERDETYSVVSSNREVRMNTPDTKMDIEKMSTSEGSKHYRIDTKSIDTKKERNTENSTKKHSDPDVIERIGKKGRFSMRSENVNTLILDPMKSSSKRSVTFQSSSKKEIRIDDQVKAYQINADTSGVSVFTESITGAYIEGASTRTQSKADVPNSISGKLALFDEPSSSHHEELWLQFLGKLGVLDPSENISRSSVELGDLKPTESTIPEMANNADFVHADVFIKSLIKERDKLIDLHINHPGTFHDTLNTADVEKAYAKLKKILIEIGKETPQSKPRYDDGLIHSNAPMIVHRLKEFQSIVAPERFTV